MKNKILFKEKVKICFNIILKIIIVYIISIIFFQLFIDGIFERALANNVFDFNPELYYWCVGNKSIIIIVYLFIVLAIIIFRSISKFFDNIYEVYNSLDDIMDKEKSRIELSDETIKFAEKINNIKYKYILNEKNAKEAEQKKNDLIVYMAHDLKTPLTSIIGYLTLLKDERSLSKELQDKYINIALNKSFRLEELTNQFFDITRYNLHEMSVTKEKIDLSFLMEQLLDECYPMLQEKKLKCVINRPNNLYFMGDGDKLARAFGNLFKNAINYSYENTNIEIDIKENEETINILFKNKGNKIPEYKLEKIFEKFYRLDEARTSSTGGAGLGLAITKEIIELHNGKIYVKNDDEFIEFYVIFCNLRHFVKLNFTTVNFPTIFIFS